MCVYNIVQCFAFLTHIKRLLIISALSACFCIVCISSLLTAFTLSSLIITDCVVILTFLTAFIINQKTAWAVNIFLTVIIVESHISFTVISQSAYILWVLTIEVINSHTVCTFNWLTAWEIKFKTELLSYLWVNADLLNIFSLQWLLCSTLSLNKENSFIRLLR